MRSSDASPIASQWNESLASAVGEDTEQTIDLLPRRRGIDEHRTQELAARRLIAAQVAADARGSGEKLCGPVLSKGDEIHRRTRVKLVPSHALEPLYEAVGQREE